MTLNILGVLDAYLESHDPGMLPILGDALEEDGRMEMAAWCRKAQANQCKTKVAGIHWHVITDRADNLLHYTEAAARRELARLVQEQLCMDCDGCDGSGWKSLAGPNGEPKCPSCGNSLQNRIPYNANQLRRCATCKTVWELVDCPKCQGRCWLLKPRQATCPECKGKGWVSFNRGQSGIVCDRCHGTGTVEG